MTIFSNFEHPSWQQQGSQGSKFLAGMFFRDPQQCAKISAPNSKKKFENCPLKAFQLHIFDYVYFAKLGFYFYFIFSAEWLMDALTAHLGPCWHLPCQTSSHRQREHTREQDSHMRRTGQLCRRDTVKKNVDNSTTIRRVTGPQPTSRWPRVHGKRVSEDAGLERTSGHATRVGKHATHVQERVSGNTRRMSRNACRETRDACPGTRVGKHASGHTRV